MYLHLIPGMTSALVFETSVTLTNNVLFPYHPYHTFHIATLNLFLKLTDKFKDWKPMTMKIHCSSKRHKQSYFSV